MGEEMAIFLRERSKGGVYRVWEVVVVMVQYTESGLSPQIVIDGHLRYLFSSSTSVTTPTIIA
jgi:hypothetical protein